MKTISLRMPEDLHEDLKEVAKIIDRSVNYTILTMLREGIDRHSIREEKP